MSRLMKLSNSCKKTLNSLLVEMVKSYKLWHTDHKAYFQEFTGIDRLFLSINAPADLAKEMNDRFHADEHCVFQLHHSNLSLVQIRELSEEVRKQNNLNCHSYELKSILEGIIYEYFNADLNSFADSFDNDGVFYKPNYEIFDKIFNRRIQQFKATFSKLVYQFPVIVFSLQNALNLSQNIRLIPLIPEKLKENVLSKFKYSRSFAPNYYLEVSVDTPCSRSLSIELAERARDTAYNVLKLLATRYSTNAVPLLSANDRTFHHFYFHRSGINVEALHTDTSIHFPVFQKDSKEFWQHFNDEKDLPNSLINIAFNIPELLLVPDMKQQRVVDRLERSLLWYGDASTDSNSYLQIQKMVSSLEAIVNFKEATTTETFKTRVRNLNITHKGICEDKAKMAAELYNARSRIVHGNSINEKLSFCPVQFCAETLLRAIFYLHLFGIHKTGFSKSLPQFIDDIPLNAII